MPKVILSFEIKPKTSPACAGHTVLIVAQASGSQVSVRDTVGGVESTVVARGLHAASVGEVVRNTTRAQWNRARRRERVLRQLIDTEGSVASRLKVACRELRLSERSVYRLLQRYRPSQNTRSLIAGRAGTRPHQRRLSAAREEIIAAAISARAAIAPQPSVSALVDDVRRRCGALGLRAVSRRAIERRLGGSGHGGRKT